MLLIICCQPWFSIQQFSVMGESVVPCCLLPEGNQIYIFYVSPLVSKLKIVFGRGQTEPERLREFFSSRAQVTALVKLMILLRGGCGIL